MLALHLILALLLQRIGCADRRASITAVLILFIEDSYLLSENILVFTKTRNTKDHIFVVKTRLFLDREVVVIPKKKNDVDGIISILYNKIIQICKNKSLSAYHPVDLLFL